MNLVTYEPWNLLHQLHSDLDRAFTTRKAAVAGDSDAGTSTADWVPAVDIKEEADRFVIHADVPGVDPDKIDVSMDSGVLTIEGRRDTESVEERNGYKRMERVRGSFFRRFSLPDTADAEQISARSRNGVLEVVIPKHEKVQPRRIQVES